VVVWFCVVLMSFCWCCLVEVFSGLFVDLGDDFLSFSSVMVRKSVCVWVGSVGSERCGVRWFLCCHVM